MNYFLLGVALGAVLVPAMRLSARQFAVFGPGLFAAMLWAARKWANWRLLVFVIPTIAIVCLQALLDRAFANWAAAGYFAGTIAAVAVLAAKPGLTAASLAINGAIALILPLLTLMPGLTLGRSEPLLSRYLGQASFGLQIPDIAARSAVPADADRRDVLADLFYSGRD